ncbi:hypothetical protein ONV78_23055 [Hahella sp. CR1]|uniref:hypothetical protein n=1 Tax=Hahella sp. CR1 TaxID=2992807 RepID=UPI002441E8A3|nr:hypothetical protein [Hahella sp. CR1]MDG9670636.1 hypothetical protein [Hahella sp. CR1]
MVIQKPDWILGSTPGKAHSVHYLVAIQYPAGLVYDVLPWAFDPPDYYFWRGLESAAAKVAGYIDLTRAIEWATGVECQQGIDSGAPDRLQWRSGEPEDKTIGYVVSLPSHYNILSWEEDGGDGEWTFPTREEHVTGYDRYVPLPEFLRFVATRLSFEDAI